MRLVGAQNAYIEAPFIVQGLLYGVVASVAVLVLLFPATYWFGQYFSAFPSLAGGFVKSIVFDYYIGNFISVAFTVIGSSLVLSAVSSFLAVRKYLSV
jgi:cell division protein FtsX